MSNENPTNKFEHFLATTVSYEFNDSADYKDEIFAKAREMMKDNLSSLELIEFMKSIISAMPTTTHQQTNIISQEDMYTFEAARIVLQFRGVKNIPSFLPKKKNTSGDVTGSDRII